MFILPFLASTHRQNVSLRAATNFLKRRIAISRISVSRGNAQDLWRRRLYDFLKTLHIIGVVVLIGNVTITAFWKVLADRTNRADLIAHSQRGVTITDWLFTLTGIAMIVVGGYGAALLQGLPLFSLDWLVAGQVLFAISGAIWLGILVPLQIRQARAAKQFNAQTPIPNSYRRDARLWLIWGVLATVPLIAAVYVMVVK